MTTVNAFVAGFNKADGKAIVATCASQAGIIDDFPPHAWMSCSDWWDAYVAFSKQDGDVGGVVTLGAPTHVDVSGNVAYVVVPTTYVFKHHGKLTTMNGSTWTVILKNEPAGWRITGWAWADGK